jgi:hypothetical protein
MPLVDPAANALTTVEHAKAWLSQSSVNNVLNNDRLQLLINSYSSAIRSYTRRQFFPETAVTRKFRYEGSGYISLAPYELRAVTTLTLYTDFPQSSWVVLNAQSATVESDYRLEPRNKTLEGTYLWLVLPELGQFSPLVPEPIVSRRPKASEVTLAGDWGCAAVPADVELACLIAVANGYRNPEGFATRSLGGLSFSENVEAAMTGDETGMALPRDARALLAPFRRKSFA